MTAPTFGIQIEQVDNEPRPGVPSDMSVVGLVGTAPDADAGAFPLNTPILMFSDDAASLLLLGDTGTLADALIGINDQFGDFLVSAKVVLVRVEEGDDTDETITNLIGDEGQKTGIYSLLEAGPTLGVIPRLISVPGYTSQQKLGVVGAHGIVGGTGYVAPFAVTATGGTGAGFTGTAQVAAGAVTGITMLTPGIYSVAPTGFDFAAGAGDDATAIPTTEKLANPVVAALSSVLSRLLAVAVVDGPASTLQAFTDWRETMTDKRIIPVETAVKYGVNAVVEPASPRIIGIGVRRDAEFGGRPFHSWANQAVHGIVGPNRPLRFSLTDGATEGQQILSQNGGIIVRGEMGVESAVGASGFIYIGTDNCSDDPIWQFYNEVRGRDYIHLLLLKTLRYYLGKFNITVQTIEAVLNTMKGILRDIKADGDILGYAVGFTRDQNTPEDLRLGKFTVDFQAEEAPVLRLLGIRSSRYRHALEILLSELEQAIDSNT